MINIQFSAPGGVMILTIGGKTSIVAHVGPTSNCQLWLIGSFENLFITSVTKEERVDLFKAAHRYAGLKKILLIDIHQNAVEKLHKVIDKSTIMSTTNYTSTNGSTMAIIMIKTLPGWLDKIN